MEREAEIIVISDVHLGTFGCRAKELLHYLNNINPKILILNGDIIDIWQFKKSYFPREHLQVLKKIVDIATNGTEVVYITGNHDEMLRKFAPLALGQIKLVNKRLLNLDCGKVWIFHGDVFDASIQHSKWLAKLGGWGYDALIRINTLTNWFLAKMGKEKYSLSKKIKNSVKKAVKYVTDFENTASELAIENQYQYVICGHIHQPQMRKVSTKKGDVIYLNSGDWIENLSALEYKNGQWELFLYDRDKLSLNDIDNHEILSSDTLESILNQMMPKMSANKSI